MPGVLPEPGWTRVYLTSGPSYHSHPPLCTGREAPLYYPATSPEEGGLRESITSRLLRVAVRTGALAFGEFRLTSGKLATYYFDGRKVTLDPEGCHLVASALLPMVLESGARAVAGPTLGADPMVAGIAMLSHQQGTPVPAMIVRKEAKEHGMGRQIEGPVTGELPVAVVDDTCATGGSLFQAIEAVEADGGTVVKVLCILDRHEEGSQELRRRGYDFASLLTVDAKGNVGPAAGAP